MIKTRLVTYFFRVLILTNCYRLSALFLRLFVLQRTCLRKDRLARRPNQKPGLLALDSSRYRDDLNVLASTEQFRVLHIHSQIQMCLVTALYGKPFNLSIEQLIDARKTRTAISERHQKAQAALQRILRHLYTFCGIQCVLNVNNRYVYDYDWIIASEAIGVRHVMLYRECLLWEGSRYFDETEVRVRNLGFNGSHIVVHNELCKKMFVLSGCVRSTDISVAGALRMDNFTRAIRKHREAPEDTRKQFLLFFFPYDMSVFGKKGTPMLNQHAYAYGIWQGREQFFREVHSTIIMLAKSHPEIDFIIKPKREMLNLPSWTLFTRLLDELKVNTTKLPNYLIHPDANVHDLILSSSVIAGLQSSTVLEGAIAGKPVILPLFDEFTATPNYQDFGWKNYLDIFDVARTPEQFCHLILDRMENNSIPEDTQLMREKLFIKYFGNIDGSATEQYSRIISREASLSSTRLL